MHLTVPAGPWPLSRKSQKTEPAVLSAAGALLTHLAPVYGFVHRAFASVYRYLVAADSHIPGRLLSASRVGKTAQDCIQKNSFFSALICWGEG